MTEATAKIQQFQTAKSSEVNSEEGMFTGVDPGRGSSVDLPEDEIWYVGTTGQFDLPRLDGEIGQFTNGEAYVDTDQEVQPKQESLKNRLASPVVKINRLQPTRERFALLQKWEGIVIQTGTDSFIANLVDLSEKGPDEEAEFPIEEVHSTDRDLIKEGAVFYWNIGYIDTENGQRIRASLIRFRRLPAWTTKELKKAEAEAKLTRKLFESK